MWLISGGVGSDGSRPVADELFQTETQSVVPSSPLLEPQGETGLAASIPAHREKNVHLDGWIALRFSKRVRMDTVNAATVTMKNGGPIASRVVAAEDGMLAFVTPQDALAAGTEYTVTVSGVRDIDGFALPIIDVAFTTAAAVVEAPITVSQGPGRPPLPPGLERKEDPAPPALQGAAGATALAGLVRNIFAKPLANARVKLDCAGKPYIGRTDNLGRFLLTGLEAGICELEVDGGEGRDADNSKDEYDGFVKYPAGRSYGKFHTAVQILGGRTNVLGHTTWMTPIDRANEVRISTVAVQREQVITNPKLKGLEVRLPPGAVVRDSNGALVDRLSITPVPASRTPFPMPKNVAFPLFFTIQPGGAYVEVNGSRYAPGVGARIVYPNRHRAPAGYKFNFWNYDPERGGWHIYGTGRVTADRRSVVPDQGVVVGRFTGAMLADWHHAPPPGPPCWALCNDGDPQAVETFQRCMHAIADGS